MWWFPTTTTHNDILLMTPNKSFFLLSNVDRKLGRRDLELFGDYLNISHGVWDDLDKGAWSLFLGEHLIQDLVASPIPLNELWRDCLEEGNVSFWCNPGILSIM